MPRTAEEILAHADDLAKRFEAEPDSDRIRDATTLRELARAFERRARAEADLASAVATARADGHTWSAIGAMLGTSGEAARQRYATQAATPRTRASRNRRAEIREWAQRRSTYVDAEDARKRA